MRYFIRAAIAALVLYTSGLAAQADVTSDKAPPPPAFIEPGFHPFQVRLKAAAILPLDGAATLDDTGIILSRLGRVGPLAVGGFTGASASISSSFIPMLDVAYYFTPNWAIEANCCVSWHRFQSAGTLAGRPLPLARPWLVLFPPSLLLHYHFTNFGAFQPYLGVGVNFTTMLFPVPMPLKYAIPLPLALLGGTSGVASLNSASISPSWGVVGQAGADYMFDENWGVNVDVKYVMMEPKVHARGSVFLRGAGQRFSPIYAPVNVDVKINPIVVSAGLTYRFGGDWGLPKLLPF